MSKHHQLVIAPAGLIFALLLFSFSVSAAPKVEEIERNGPSSNRIDVVVMGDGYTSTEQDKFKSDAAAMIDYMYSQTPYKEYRKHYNFYLVSLVSKESGADHPSQNDYRDTALNATFEAYGIDRLLVVDDAKALQAASEAVPQVDFVYAVVNDSMYGGSGGTVAVASTHAQAAEIIAHEVGHMLADLADEYPDAYPAYDPYTPMQANVTRETTLSRVPWNLWIEKGTPLPTPQTLAYFNTVGLFEGARYQSTGIYRPRFNCRMRQLGLPFCQVCAERIIEVTYQRDSPTDASGGTVVAAAGSTVELDAQPVQTPGGTLKVSWSVDGQARAETTDKLSLTVTKDQHVIALLKDTASLIRKEGVQTLAQAAVEWDIRAQGGPVDGDQSEADLSGDGEMTAEEETASEDEAASEGGAEGDGSANPDGDADAKAESDAPEEEKGLIDQLLSGDGSGGGCSAANPPGASWLLLLAGLVLARRRIISFSIRE